MSLCKAIDLYLQDKGITQASICQKANITTNALCLSLKGKRKLTADEYVAICNALEVPYDLFVTQAKER